MTPSESAKIENLTNHRVCDLRRLDDAENRRERIARATDSAVENPLFTAQTQSLRWSKWLGHPAQLYELVDTKVFPWMRRRD